MEEMADLKQELRLQIDFWDLKQETEEKISQGSFLLEDAFEKVGGTNPFVFTRELGAFSQVKLLDVYSRLYCAGTVRREYCIELGQKDASLPLWKDKLELQSWSVVCRSQETLRGKDRKLFLRLCRAYLFCSAERHGGSGICTEAENGM